MIECEICGREFKTKQGLSGHMQWVHPDAAKRTKQVQLARPADSRSIERIDKRLTLVEEDVERIKSSKSSVTTSQPKSVRDSESFNTSGTDGSEADTGQSHEEEWSRFKSTWRTWYDDDESEEHLDSLPWKEEIERVIIGVGGMVDINTDKLNKLANQIRDLSNGLDKINTKLTSLESQIGRLLGQEGNRARGLETLRQEVSDLRIVVSQELNNLTKKANEINDSLWLPAVTHDGINIGVISRLELIETRQKDLERKLK